MKTRDLIKIINLLMVAVERKAVVSQYDHVVFYDGAISTFNGKLFVSHPIDLDLDCSVVAEDLMSVLKTVDSEEVKLDLVDNLLLVTSEDVAASLSTDVYEDNVVKTIKAMNVGSMDWENAKDTPKDFIEGLSNCRFSVSKDVSCHMNTNCIHTVDNVMESTDGFRCTEYILDGDIEEMLFPVSSAIALTSFSPVCYIKDGGWCHFMDENDVIFSVAIMEGTFPDIAGVIENSKPEVSITIPMQISNILGEFGKLSSGESDVFKFMEVAIKDGSVLCKTDKQGCKVTKKIAFPEGKEEVTFLISPTLLNSVLSKTNTIGINYTNNVASFSAKNFNHVITLPQADEKKDDDVPF